MAAFVRALALCPGGASALLPLPAVVRSRSAHVEAAADAPENNDTESASAASGENESAVSASAHVGVVADDEEGILVSMKRLSRTCKQYLDTLDEDQSQEPDERASKGAGVANLTKRVISTSESADDEMTPPHAVRSASTGSADGDRPMVDPVAIEVMRIIVATTREAEGAVAVHKESEAARAVAAAADSGTGSRESADDVSASDSVSSAEAMDALKKMYADRMADHGLCSSMKGLAGKGYKYLDKMKQQGSYKPSVMQRVKNEARGMTTGLPNAWASTIVVRYDKRLPYVMRAFIGGVEDTPYDSAALIFDILAKKNYPKGPPECNIVTTHGGRMRLNPK